MELIDVSVRYIYLPKGVEKTMTLFSKYGGEYAMFVPGGSGGTRKSTIIFHHICM